MRRIDKNRIGEKRIMKCGEEAEIVEYRSVRDIVVKFLKTGELIRCEYGNFKKGTIKSHFTPTVYGMGIVGLERTKDVSGKALRSYNIWKHMLQRCYDKNYQRKHPTYINCKICNKWLFYPNFKKWYEDNYYEVEGQRMDLDKDILVKGNKTYSPETCIFVPQKLNILFINRELDRGDLPIGVCWHKSTNRYSAQYNSLVLNNDNRKSRHLGLYSTPEEAFNSYKKVKEENIKQVADYYKNKIPEKLYEAMYRYEVDITD